MFTYLFVGKRTRVRKKEMPPNTSSEKCSVIVTIYKYFEAESEERHQSIAEIKCLKEHCQINEICVFSMYPYVN